MGLTGMYSGWSPKTIANLVDLFFSQCRFGTGVEKSNFGLHLVSWRWKWWCNGNIMGFNVVNLIQNHPHKRFIIGYNRIWDPLVGMMLHDPTCLVHGMFFCWRDSFWVNYRFSFWAFFFDFCFPVCLLFCSSLLLCFDNSLLFCFSTFLLLCFFASLLLRWAFSLHHRFFHFSLRFLLFQLLCFSAFWFSLLLCSHAFLLLLNQA